MFLLVSTVALAASTSPTVNWYTNTNLEGNKALMATNPSAFSGFFFCCGLWNFADNGTFESRNTDAVQQNIAYFGQMQQSRDFSEAIGGGSDL